MGLDQRAGGAEEGGAVGGKPHRARRAFDQSLAKQRFQPLQLHADRGLRFAERFGGAGEALQFGDQQEGVHGRDIEGGYHQGSLSLLSFMIRYQNDGRGSS